ncbi:tRNA1(Val) (adenine(37)-N6)-methyltransferase [Arcobacter sp. FWKO B]|uniref:tRNA1(Val) (adenine(37)-N6)-methyltransferase n=1 Tax=Arcobacter sp. FWKO B TaxID=2593672 RepID=UPI0018A4D2DA|nr:methyltransferase [Arcobacter sp. FWKO B]QOG13054.1 methyltransferase [Arcobacter sp. FWKO B]
MLIYQLVNGYCYNSDTYFLYNFILYNLEKLKNPKGDILDVGSGSGILGLLVAREYENMILSQVEIQKDFCFLSKKNAQINQIKANMYEGSFFHIEFDKKFDMIVSNPPFYHTNSLKSENENLKIARYNTNFTLNDFIQKASKIIKPNGRLFFCYDVKQINDIIATLYKYKFNLEALQFVHPFKHKDASLVLVYAKKSSNSLVKICPPAIVFDGGDYSVETFHIYQKASTHSIKCEL